jgi:Protein of unknown function (DUF1565)
MDPMVTSSSARDTRAKHALRRRRALVGFVQSAVVCALFLLALLGTGHGAAPTTYHVATSGSDSNPGTRANPFRTIQKGVDVARAGDTILVHAGAYPQQVQIRRSGTVAQPIRLASAGDGTVTVNPTLPSIDPTCSDGSPERTRAIEIRQGKDNWIIQGLTIVGGVAISAAFPADFSEALIFDRTLPGRGLYDPAGAETTLPLLGADPADGVQVLDNVIRERGIQGIGARFGVVSGNDVGNIICGAGAAILLSRFSDFWNIHDNVIHDTPAHLRHFMSEAIRVSNASMYNTIEANFARDIGGLGRGMTTDVNAGWNVFRGNTVRRAQAGFNDQAGGWGNQWIGNRAESNRGAGYAFRLKDDYLLWRDDRTPRFTVVRCNVSVGNLTDLNVGFIQDAVFQGNAFTKIQLGVNMRTLWGPLQNRYDGAPEPPAPNPAPGICS